MDFTEINSRGKRGELLGRIDRQNSRFRTAKTIIIKFGLHASFVELESAKNSVNECSQLASLDKNNALREIKLRLSYLQGKSTTMSVIAHQTEKEWISANKKSRQRMSQTQAEGAAEQHADRLEDAHLRAHHSCFTTSERC
ncbi:uncharacterized protein TNCV_164761 [Trichonephila clavipes]|nr:uncharacterized protein TNCV_164761 [Trichonephila clavipes]